MAGTRAGKVDGAGDHLLAGSGFADDQDVAPPGGNERDKFNDLQHGRAGTHKECAPCRSGLNCRSHHFAGSKSVHRHQFDRRQKLATLGKVATNAGIGRSTR
jgi:hypothetical protein